MKQACFANADTLNDSDMLRSIRPYTKIIIG